MLRSFPYRVAARNVGVAMNQRIAADLVVLLFVILLRAQIGKMIEIARSTAIKEIVKTLIAVASTMLDTCIVHRVVHVFV